MKILHVITSLQTGGAEKLMVDLLPRLRDAGNEVELAIFDGRITPFYEKLQEKGITIHRFVPNGGNVYNPINLWKLIRLIRRGCYDIVHTHNTAPQLFAALCSVLCSVVLVTTEHNTSNRRRGWKWYVPIDKWMYSRYKEIICCSEKAKLNLCQFISSNKGITINNGVNINAFYEATEDAELRAQFAKDARIITMVAGFRWEKDQDTLIKALKFLDDQFHVLLVGDGVRRHELESLAKEHRLSERVHFLGLRSDVPEILKSSDFVVMSSHFEGLSLSSVEGMAVGKPMLASNVDGLKQVVEGAGLLFKEGDAEQLAALISKLDQNPDFYKQVAQSCAKRANEYDISKMVDAYNAVYVQLMSN